MNIRNQGKKQAEEESEVDHKFTSHGLRMSTK